MMSAVTICTLLLIACATRHVYAAALYENDLNGLGIFGGLPVDITEVPYMAQYRKDNDLKFCGAVIVHEKFVLSAAHCAKSMQATGSIVKVGTDSREGGDDYKIEKVFIHPNNSQLDYDVAVLKLTTKLKFSNKVKAIKMSDRNDQPGDGERLLTLGFGLTEKKKHSDKLLKVEIPLFNHESCAKMFPNDNIVRLICAGGEEGKGICHGDSGGPLVYKNKLIGLVCGGVRCGQLGVPGVFTNIPAMRNFIDDVIKNNV